MRPNGDGRPVKIFSKGLIPHSDILLRDEDAYHWADDFAEKKRIVAQIRQAKDIVKEIDRTPPARERFRNEVLPRSHAEAQQRRIERLARFLAANVGSPSPFKRFERLDLYLSSSCTLEEAMQAEALLPDEVFGPDDAARAQELQKLVKQIEQLEARAAALTPPPFMAPGPDGPIVDTRDVFERFWRDRQHCCRDKICPRGFPIGTAPHGEQHAYKVLGIATAINPKGDQAASRN